MKTKLVAAIGLFLFSQTLLASLLTVVPGDTEINGVTVNKSASLDVEGKAVQLASAGAGLRKKTIAQVKVYVGQLYVSNLDRFRDPNLTPLNSLDFNDMTVALQMTMVHKGTTDQLSEGFVDGFKSNKIDPTATPYSTLVSSVREAGPINVDDGTQTLTLVGRRLVDGSEEIVYENSETGKTMSVKGTKGFIKNVYSIWLGEPADNGLVNLKKAFVGGK